MAKPSIWMRSWRRWNWVDGIFGGLGLHPRFVARCLDVEVISDGATEQEAVANLYDALELYFEDHETVDSTNAERG